MSVSNKFLETTLFPIMDFKQNQYDGIMLKTHNDCKNCNKECLKSSQEKNYILNLCSNEVLYFKISINGRNFIINGLKNTYSLLNRQEKKKYTNKLFFKHIEKVKIWVDKIEKINQISIDKKDVINENNSIFIHDMKKVYSSMLRKFENYISKNCNFQEDIDDNLKNLDSDLLSIYKSINLLEYQFKNIDYISNPESIKFGQLREIHIYKAIDKLNRILRTNVPNKIELKGSSHKKLFVYESFINLPFILIDNALKYSLKDQSIEININDSLQDRVEIEIISYSPLINDEDKKHIFEKYYRGCNVKTLVPEGQGIGLFLARIIADAHDINITLVDNQKKNFEIEDITYCENCFKLIVKSLK